MESNVKTAQPEEFIHMLTKTGRFRLFLISRLPLAWLAGVRLENVTQQQAQVSIKYGYRNKNPFQSIYFAALSMAAEMSTGLLGFMHVYQSNPRISMLVVNMGADFTKKAVGKIIFTCNDGHKIAETIQRSIDTGEGQTITAVTTGVDEQDEPVATFTFTWSFKPKSQ